MKEENIPILIFAAILIIGIIWMCIDEHLKYKKWLKSLTIGSKWFVEMRDNDFETTRFEVEVLRIGEHDVELRYSDGSKRITSKRMFNYEKWQPLKNEQR